MPMPDIVINNNTDKQITVKIVSKVALLKDVDSFNAFRVDAHDYEPTEIRIDIVSVRDKQPT